MSTPAASMTLGNTMKVTGTVKGAGATKVILQQRTGTVWSTWMTASVVGGAYTLNYKPAAPGARAIRVYAPGTTSHTYGISTAKTITVYKWNYLASFNQTSRLVAQNSFWWAGESVANINGHAYIHSLRDNRSATRSSPGFVEYNLSRACLTFRMTGGVADESASDGSAQLEIATDGVQRWARTMSLGQSENVSLSVSGGLRLRLSDILVVRPKVFPIVYPAFGDARILCSF